MATRNLSASIVAGVGLALGIGIPAQATEVTAGHATTSAHMARQALTALDARWNAEAAAFKKQHDAFLALTALDARWNAQALYFGLR
jgi:hypothetical protein